jgi:hypothetical protein
VRYSYPGINVTTPGTVRYACRSSFNPSLILGPTQVTAQCCCLFRDVDTCSVLSELTLASRLNGLTNSDTADGSKGSIYVLADISCLPYAPCRMESSTNPRRIGFLGFDGITALDLVGPTEAFAAAVVNGDHRAPTRCYEVLTIGLTKKAFVAESGVVQTARES